jgi:lipopolysaccharide transport system permease protein
MSYVPAASGSRKPTDIIRPPRGFAPINVAELWRHRDLLMFMLLRDIRVTISGTRFGVLWLVLPPLAMTLVLATVLGFFFRVPSALMPYPVLVISGLALWTYFAGVVSRASSSMLASAGLITKVYFPRILIPSIPVLGGVVELGVLTLCVCAIAAGFGIWPRWHWLLLPLPLLLLVALALGAAVWTSALAVRHRDFANALPVVLQIGLYASPVLYPIALVPISWRTFYDLNPIVGIIETVRWMLAPGAAFPTFGLLVTVAFAAVLFISGLFYFRRVEDSISDLV